MTADPVPLGTPSAATTIPVPDITDGRPCAKRIMTLCNALRFKKSQSTRLLGRQNARRNALDADDYALTDVLPITLRPCDRGIEKGWIWLCLTTQYSRTYSITSR